MNADRGRHLAEVVREYRAHLREVLAEVAERDKPLTVPAAYLKTRPPERPPSISIVTPSFQQGRFLDRTIFSVVAQRYPSGALSVR